MKISIRALKKLVTEASEDRAIALARQARKGDADAVQVLKDVLEEQNNTYLLSLLQNPDPAYHEFAINLMLNPPNLDMVWDELEDVIIDEDLAQYGEPGGDLDDAVKEILKSHGMLSPHGTPEEQSFLNVCSSAAEEAYYADAGEYGESTPGEPKHHREEAEKFWRIAQNRLGHLAGKPLKDVAHRAELETFIKSQNLKALIQLEKRVNSSAHKWDPYADVPVTTQTDAPRENLASVQSRLKMKETIVDLVKKQFKLKKSDARIAVDAMIKMSITPANKSWCEEELENIALKIHDKSKAKKKR